MIETRCTTIGNNQPYHIYVLGERETLCSLEVSERPRISNPFVKSLIYFGQVCPTCVEQERAVQALEALVE